jgi:hypothetical protein
LTKNINIQKHQLPTGGLAIVGGDKTRISTWELYSTSVPARQNSTEQQELLPYFYNIIQRATAKRDTTQSPTIAKPCSLAAIL